MTNQPHKPRVFIVVPAFNEAAKIGTVLAELTGRWRDVVVVDDGSSDLTGPAARRHRVWLLRHYANRGQGAALQTGVRFAVERGADVVVTFDSDGQHDPNDVPALIAPVVAGECDVALGSRFLGRAPDIPVVRRVLLKAGVVFTFLTSRIWATDVHNGLRAFSRRAASELSITMDRMAHASEIFDQIRVHRWRFREVPVTIRYTRYSLAKGQTSWDAVRIAFQVLIEKLRQ